LTANTSLVYATHNANYVEATGSTSTVTISTQASGSWATDSHFWIANRRDSGTITVAPAGGVTLILAGSSSGSFTMSHTDRPVHIWRSASDVWRVIS
jgi:hypothetical protein